MDFFNGDNPITGCLGGFGGFFIIAFLAVTSMVRDDFQDNPKIDKNLSKQSVPIIPAYYNQYLENDK
jgi:hypothetical protein